MSYRARVVTDAAGVSPYAWGSAWQAPDPQPVALASMTRGAGAPAAASPADDGHAARQQQLAALERDAFAKGYEQGERAGNEAAGKRGEAMLRRLSETLTELTALRATMIRQTELQMVELAMAVARRVVHREISLDRDLLIAIARVALDRLGDSGQVTVRLHPEEYEATGAARVAASAGGAVTFVADPRVGRGGCRVESEVGLLDAGVDAQIQEIARALLGDAQESSHALRRA